MMLLAYSIVGCEKVERAGKKVRQMIREGSAASTKATEAVEHFHQEYNAGNYAGIYAEADECFQKAQPEEAFVALLSTVKEKLGDVTSTTRTGWQINTAGGRTTARLTYRVKYQHGKGTETFRLEGTAEKMAILSWNIDSDRLK